MLKLPTLIALFICLVYSNNEQNVDTELESKQLHNVDTELRNEQQHHVDTELHSKQQVPLKEGEETKNTFRTIKGQYVEEKQSRKPCRNKNRRLGDKENKDLNIFESLPLTASLEQTNTATKGNKMVTSSIHGANYNQKTEDTEVESDNSDSQSKSCDCDNCLLDANKKVLQFESLAFDNPFYNSAIDIKSGEPEFADNNSTTSNKANQRALDEYTSVESNVPAVSNVSPKINTDKRTKPCVKAFNPNTRRRNKCGKVDRSENLTTTPTTRRILPGIIESPTNQELQENELYQDSPQLNPHDDTGVESRQNYFPKVQKVSNSYDIDLVHNMNINEASLSPSSPPIGDYVENQLTEPIRGKGIYDMKDAGVMLLENSRVCYACSTMSDPTCWTPDRRTTVKYCHKGHRSCLIKSFKHKGKFVIIRDCGSQCAPGGEENYSSCSICHSDLCNGASSLTIYSTGIAIIVISIISFNTH